MTEGPPKKLLPPVLLLLAIIAMVAIHFLLPLAQIVEGVWRFAGIVPVVAGLGVIIWGAHLFRRHGTAIRPADHSTALVIEGPFLFSRNPMYVGMVCTLAGVALGLGSATPWLAIPVFVAIIHWK